MSSLVSVIIPCYNGAAFLSQALLSVAWQVYQRWECILIDDGSTDDSAALFHSFANRDARFRYHRQENRGLAAARNKGIELARGEFVQFLDADDVLLREKLVRCVSRFVQTPELDMVYTEYVYFERDQRFVRSLSAKIPSEDVLKAFLSEWDRSFNTPVHTFLFRRELIASVRFTEERRSHAEDWECWIRVAALRPRYGYIDEVLVIYRVSSNTLVSEASKLFHAKIDVLAKALTMDACKPYDAEIRGSMAYYHERLAMAYFRERAFKQGWRAMRRQWGGATFSTRVKLVSWLLVMMFVSLERVVAVRDWLFSHTPIRWGSWKTFRQWRPPESVRKIMSSEA